MSRSFLTAFVIGIAVIAVAITGMLYVQRGARVGLLGSILKVRTAPLDENSSIAVIDFRYRNPANDAFVVRTVTVILEEKDGKQFQGATVSESDAKRLFEGLPLLGQKYNDTLVTQDKIPPGASADKMVAVRFEAPESRLENRKRFLLRIEDVDGPVTEFSER